MKQTLITLLSILLIIIALAGCITTDPFAGWDVVKVKEKEIDRYTLYETIDQEGGVISRKDGEFELWWKQRKEK